MLKVAVTTSKQAKGKYAQLYVEVYLSNVLLDKYLIKGKRYHIKYKSLHMIYFACRKYGHYAYMQSVRNDSQNKESLIREEGIRSDNGSTPKSNKKLIYGEWMIA